MAKTYYQRKLSHPDWQKKRLEIFNRDGFKCTICHSKDKELHIHHIYYINNTLPQNYPNSALKTLCHECHLLEEEDLKSLSNTIINRLRKTGADSFDINLLIQAIEKCIESGIRLDNIIENIVSYGYCNEDEREEINIWLWKIMKSKNKKNG